MVSDAPRTARLEHDAAGHPLYVPGWSRRCDIHETNIRDGGSCPRCLIDKEPTMNHAAPPLPHDLAELKIRLEAAHSGANPKQQYGDMKVPLHLVPPALSIGAARALGEGAKKYGAWNFRHTNVESMTYIGAIQRHIAAYLDGEDIDPESTVGKRHLDGIAACVAILLDSHDRGTLIDNRPPKGGSPRLLRSPGFVEPVTP